MATKETICAGSMAQAQREAGVRTRPRRVSVQLKVMLELTAGNLVKAIVDDVSKDGFRLRTRAILHPGQTVFMHLQRERLTCEVRWVSRPEAGGVFIGAAAAPSW